AIRVRNREPGKSTRANWSATMFAPRIVPRNDADAMPGRFTNDEKKKARAPCIATKPRVVTGTFQRMSRLSVMCEKKPSLEIIPRPRWSSTCGTMYRAHTQLAYARGFASREPQTVHGRAQDTES